MLEQVDDLSVDFERPFIIQLINVEACHTNYCNTAYYK